LFILEQSQCDSTHARVAARKHVAQRIDGQRLAAGAGFQFIGLLLDDARGHLLAVTNTFFDNLGLIRHLFIAIADWAHFPAVTLAGVVLVLLDAAQDISLGRQLTLALGPILTSQGGFICRISADAFILLSHLQ
jgi:hypothetical protein